MQNVAIAIIIVIATYCSEDTQSRRPNCHRGVEFSVVSASRRVKLRRVNSAPALAQYLVNVLTDGGVAPISCVVRPRFAVFAAWSLQLGDEPHEMSALGSRKRPNDPPSEFRF